MFLIIGIQLYADAIPAGIVPNRDAERERVAKRRSVEPDIINPEIVAVIITQYVKFDSIQMRPINHRAPSVRVRIERVEAYSIFGPIVANIYTFTKKIRAILIAYTTLGIAALVANMQVDA